MTGTNATQTLVDSVALRTAEPVARRLRGLSDRSIAWLFILPTMLLLLAINIFPLIWAIRLSFTGLMANLPAPDRKHLEIDIRRAYDLLVKEWLRHMQHLKTDYPYLFSLAVRTNPFDPDAKVEVT